MPQDMVFSGYPLKRVPPLKRCCNNGPIGLARCNSVSRCCLCAADWVSPLKEPAMNGTSGFQQDAQKGRPARPQQAKWRCVLCSVRGASERSENDAGGLFQHPARSAVVYLPITMTNRLLHNQRPQFGKEPWQLSPCSRPHRSLHRHQHKGRNGS